MNANAYPETAETETTESSDTRPTERIDHPESLPLDITFEILKNRRRRLVLEYLREDGDTVTIGELAEHIAAIENEITVQQLNAQQRKRVYIGLYQCHLPKMDDAGVIAFNQSRGRIDLDPQAEPLFDYLDISHDPVEDVNPIYCAGLAVGAGVLFVAASALSAPPIASLAIFVALVVGVVVTTADGWLDND